MQNASTLLVNQLYAQTAGTATNRPKAVVTSASEIPPATADKPAVFSDDIPRKALMIPTVVPKRPTNGAVAPIVARPERPRFNSALTIASARSHARREDSICSPA